MSFGWSTVCPGRLLYTWFVTTVLLTYESKLHIVLKKKKPKLESFPPDTNKPRPSFNLLQECDLLLVSLKLSAQPLCGPPQDRNHGVPFPSKRGPGWNNLFLFFFANKKDLFIIYLFTIEKNNLFLLFFLLFFFCLTLLPIKIFYFMQLLRTALYLLDRMVPAWWIVEQSQSDLQIYLVDLAVFWIIFLFCYVSF